jgi:hypothetical protein
MNNATRQVLIAVGRGAEVLTHRIIVRSHGTKPYYVDLDDETYAEQGLRLLAEGFGLPRDAARDLIENA